jgi:hypothetical protein
MRSASATRRERSCSGFFFHNFSAPRAHFLEIQTPDSSRRSSRKSCDETLPFSTPRVDPARRAGKML